MQEDISPRDHHTREMYAHYGLAMYYAQVVEAGLKNALVMAQLDAEDFASMDDFDDAWATNFTTAMGRLVGKMTAHLDGDDELGADLRLALAMRN